MKIIKLFYKLRDMRYSNYFYLFLYSIIFTLISFVSANVSSIIYDYPFHLGRIVGLAHSIRHGDYLPNLNYLFLNGSGYAVPMFYGNWMLYIPALVFIKTKIATFAFTVFVGQTTLFTVFSTNYVLEKITKSKLRSFLGAIAVSCSVTYFGFGMSAVVPLIPLLVYGIYKVIYLDKLNPCLLAVTIALLVQTHIISTIVLAIFSLFLVIFNIKKITFKKIRSFFVSLIISLFLTSGFIVQYLEQNKSQEFFVNWKLRNFPFPTEALMSPGNLIEIIQNYYWHEMFIFLIISFVIFLKLSNYSKQLIIVTSLMFVISSNLVPWSILKNTFLAVFQYTERLIYLLPIFVIIALVSSASKTIVYIVVTLQLVIYLFAFPLKFTAQSVPYAERGYQSTAAAIMDNTNRDALNAYTSPLNYTYDTSGDEYLNIDVNHENIRNGTIQKFNFDNNRIEISNIRHGYNKLEFDVNLKSLEKQTVVVPRIWYRGYNVEYSKGASGSQPHLVYIDRTDKEIEELKKLRKPNLVKKVLYDGRAAIDISSSGHVVVQYKKTLIQWIGFVFEFLSFILLIALVVLVKFQRQ
ncbi:hypothetical protein [Streptococcus pluranimalium]|uniref:hypothetical protein n=1 Tax=Streptococcus pluranimalium TaxID=82348 RepID=UPI003F691F04